MNEMSWLRVLDSCSDNRKSKIQNLKWVAVCTLVLTFAMCGEVAQAQQATKIPRIGFLQRRVAPTATNPDPLGEAFLQGLRDLGYIEGKNIFIEHRYGEGSEDRLPNLVAGRTRAT